MTPFLLGKFGSQTDAACVILNRPEFSATVRSFVFDPSGTICMRLNSGERLLRDESLNGISIGTSFEIFRLMG